MWGGKSLRRYFCLSQVSVSSLIECGFCNLWRRLWAVNAYHASFAVVAIFFFLFLRGGVSSGDTGVKDMESALYISIVTWEMNRLSHNSWAVVNCQAIFWEAWVSVSGFSVRVKKIQFESVSAAEGHVLNNIHVFAEGTPAWGKAYSWFSFGCLPK